MLDQSTTEPKVRSALIISGRLKKLLPGVSPALLWTAAAFAGAGRINWVRGWICVAIYVLVMTFVGALVRRLNPALLKARGIFMRKDTRPFDRIFMSVYLPLTFIQALVAGLDVVRFHGMVMPPWTLIPGVALFLAAMALVTWTPLVNPFAEATVRLQTDRGHTVVTAGPYCIVRHPMYVGSILMYPATALMFGSGWAMVVAASMVLLIIWRTAQEDLFLHDELSGYAEYAARTPFRLLPGLW